MTYTPETQSMLAELLSGNGCDVCGAANSQRHFDDCPKHPENVGSDMAEKVWTASEIAEVFRVADQQLADLRERGHSRPEAVAYDSVRRLLGVES